MKHETPASSRKTPKPTILHKDDSLIAVNKPAGVWPREGVFDDPGVYELIAPGVDPDNVTFVQINPLEFEISGIVIYAANNAAAETIRAQFGDGTARFQYSAIVRGPVLNDSGTIAPDNDSASSGTIWKVRDAFVAFALLECVTSGLAEHQIRRDLQHAGMPLAVDDRFGGANHLMLSSFKAGYRKSRRRPERPLIERPSLHLASVTLRHPGNDRELTIDAEPPKDFRALLNQLDRFARVPK